jgi:hypothetical protein
MNVLQQAFDEVSLNRLIVRLISQKAEEHGYSLTDAQLTAIEEQVSNAKGDTLTIELADDQNIDLRIDVEDEDIDRLLDKYSDELQDSMPQMIEDASKVILADLKSRALKC